MNERAPSHCPCGSLENFNHCCGRYIDNSDNAPTPEALMRSRYSAFVIGNATYIQKTLHPSKKKKDDEVQLKLSIDKTQWLSLNVIEAPHVAPLVDQGVVEFVAFFNEDGVHQLHERSNFIRENGDWYYTEGEILPPIKLKRNDSCYCGSGKKLKKCHSTV